MNLSWTAGLLLAATAANGIAAGATLDQAVKQLPARRLIGAPAYLDYVRAADLRNGLVWYPIVGIGAAAVSVAAVVVGLLAHPPTVLVFALVATGVGTVAHSAATSRAAPTLLALRRGDHSPQAVEAVLNRFATINVVRAAAIVLTLAAAIWALVETIA